MKDDSISRQAATTIPVMPKEHRHYQTYNLDDAYEQGWNDLQECIENLPPVQPKRGKWIPHMEQSREYIGTVLINVHYDYWLCDTCGYRVKNGQPMHNFCPNCGADMRGNEDGTD